MKHIKAVLEYNWIEKTSDRALTEMENRIADLCCYPNHFNAKYFDIWQRIVEERKQRNIGRDTICYSCSKGISDGPHKLCPICNGQY